MGISQTRQFHLQVRGWGWEEYSSSRLEETISTKAVIGSVSETSMYDEGFDEARPDFSIHAHHDGHHRVNDSDDRGRGDVHSDGSLTDATEALGTGAGGGDGGRGGGGGGDE